MDKLNKIYSKWRWLIYNNLSMYDEILLESILSGKVKKIQNQYFSADGHVINNEILICFKFEKFNVSNKKILKYDKIQEIILSENRNKSLLLYSNVRSNFIENCLIDITKFNKLELTIKIISNYINYLGWDILNYQELISSLSGRFLNSTKKLVGTKKIMEYLFDNYNNRDILLSKIFENFNPSEMVLSRLNDDFRGSAIFDYNWLFNNDLNKTIRIIENEIRLHNNQNIIGAFYNENILFKEILNRFGNKYKVISQGSPGWLSNQRFDIYFPELNIAIEYQGAQHFKPVDFGGKGMKIARKQFKLNQKRDLIKLEKSKNNDCILIYVEAGYNLNKVLNKIKKAISVKKEQHLL